MLTAKQIEEIREREQKSTKGPWHAQGREVWQTIFPAIGLRKNIALCWIHPKQQAYLDAKFVANSRTDIPALLSDNDALRERNKALELALRHCLEKGKRWHPCDPVVVEANALLTHGGTDEA